VEQNWWLDVYLNLVYMHATVQFFYVY